MIGEKPISVQAFIASASLCATRDIPLISPNMTVLQCILLIKSVYPNLFGNAVCFNIKANVMTKHTSMNVDK